MSVDKINNLGDLIEAFNKEKLFRNVSQKTNINDVFVKAYKIFAKINFCKNNKILIAPVGSSVLGNTEHQIMLEAVPFGIFNVPRDEKKDHAKYILKYIAIANYFAAPVTKKAFKKIINDLENFTYFYKEDESIKTKNDNDSITVSPDYKIIEKSERLNSFRFESIGLDTRKQNTIKFNENTYDQLESFLNSKTEENKNPSSTTKPSKLDTLPLDNLFNYFKESGMEYAYYFFPPPFLKRTDKISDPYGTLVIITSKNIEQETLKLCQYFTEKLLTIFRVVYTLRLEYQLKFTQTRSAINSILIDSYAHNISAHSLNFLQALFNYRNEQYLKQHYSIPQFSRLANLPLNILSYSDFFSTNTKNKDIDSNALKHYKALDVSDNSNTVFDSTLLDYIQYSNQFKDKDGNKLEASDLLKYGDGEGKIPMPLDYAIAPLLTYLRDKGAFWSGVIRDNEATPSRIVSMYDLLMEMFNNPLFIGSIMAAEEFFVVHVFVDVEKGPNKINDRHLLTINIKEFVEAEMLGQKKASETLLSTKESAGSNNRNGYEYINEGNYSNLNFVRLAKNHEDLRKKLQEQTILLPGGDVGKHAFFTIVENTLRNAKHIVNEHRDAIKENGLELHFQIRGYNYLLQKKILKYVYGSQASIKVHLKRNETALKMLIQNGVKVKLKDFLKNTIKIPINNSLCDRLAESLIEDKELYLIGINLNYRIKTGKKVKLAYPFQVTDSDSEKGQNEQFNMIKSVIWSSYQPILTDDGHPRMGGSSQEKVCAAALFNKTFTSAEYPHKDVEGYYPWIAYNLYPDSPAYIKKNLIYNDKLRVIRSKEKRRELLETIITNDTTPPFFDKNLKALADASFQKNLYIKFFHIWKAKNVQVVENKMEDEKSNNSPRFIDSIPRYKIAVVSDEGSIKVLQKRAVVRILKKDEKIKSPIEMDTSDKQAEKKFGLIYQRWNEKWLKDSKYKSIKFQKENAIIIGEEGQQEILVKGKNEGKTLIIKIDHDDGAKHSEVCKIRNHGALLKTICNNSNHKDFTGGKVKIDEAKQQELLETVLTKIFIADNRLFSLVYHYTFGDNTEKDKKKDKVLKQSLHLHIVDENIETINDLIKEIGDLKEQHFLIFHLSYADKLSHDFKDHANRYEELIDKIFSLNSSEPLPHNTIIAMTTGRGRADWLNKTGRHRHHCIHVPIESLQTAIQQGVLFKDDFDIKYNLCKVLFGS